MNSKIKQSDTNQAARNDVDPTHSVLVPDHNGTVQQQGNTNNAP